MIVNNGKLNSALYQRSLNEVVQRFLVVVFDGWGYHIICAVDEKSINLIDNC